MEFFFADDSSQKGSRRSMGQLIALGGLMLGEESLRPLQEQINALCEKFKIPPSTELKWSPGRDNWIRDNLTGDKRSECYREAVKIAKNLGGRAIVIIWDTGRTTLHGKEALRKTMDYLYERVTMHLEDRGQLGLIITDRPSGGKKDEDTLLKDVVETMQIGTKFVKSTQIALNLLTAPSHLLRHLQVADIITGVTTARVAGYTEYSESVFEEIKPMFIKNWAGYAGGSGLKLFPNALINIYYYVLGESGYMRGNTGITLPWRKLPYYYSGDDPSSRTDERGDRTESENKKT